MTSALDRYLPKGAAVKLLKHSNGKNTEVPLSVVQASESVRYVLLYFSASWCPPCRGFTPQLIEFYEAHAKAKKFEVVFVSWDEEEEEYNGYFAKMPWLAVPFTTKTADGKQSVREYLIQKFHIQTIPTVIVLDAATGNVASTTARANVPRDPEGKGFPWPQSKL